MERHPCHCVKAGVTVLRERLALTEGEALDLVARVPVVVALEPRLLALQAGALAPLLGVPPAALVQLLGRCLGLVAVPAEVLGANLSNLAEALGVRVEAAMQVALEQPLMLTAPVRAPRRLFAPPPPPPPPPPDLQQRGGSSGFAVRLCLRRPALPVTSRSSRRSCRRLTRSSLRWR